MIESFQKVKRNGQITIPKWIRDEYGIKDGDMCDFKVEGDTILMRVIDVHLIPRKLMREVVE